MNCDLSVIVLTYNGKKYLDALFASFSAVEDAGFTWEIVLVDNASTDGTKEYVREHLEPRFSNLRYIYSEQNTGFAGGNNLGAREARGEYILFLNNDTSISPDFLQNMLACIRKTGAGIVGGKLVFYHDFIPLDVIPDGDGLILDSRIGVNDASWPVDNKFIKNVAHRGELLHIREPGRLYIPMLAGPGAYTFTWGLREGSGAVLCGGHKMPVDKGKIILTAAECERHSVTLIQNAGTAINDDYNGYDIGFTEEDHGQYDAPRELEAACGAAMILRRDLFLTAGGFDDTFFMYYEDVDLSYRVRGMGRKIRFCPEAVVRHIHTGSSQEWSPFFMYYVYRNRLLFILKNFGVKDYRRERRKYMKEVVHAWRTRRFRRPKTKALLSVLRLQWSYRGGKG